MRPLLCPLDCILPRDSFSRHRIALLLLMPHPVMPPSSPPSPNSPADQTSSLFSTPLDDTIRKLPSTATSGFPTPIDSEIIELEDSGRRVLFASSPRIDNSPIITATTVSVGRMPRKKRSAPVDGDSDTQGVPKRVKVGKRNNLETERKKKQARVSTSPLPPEHTQPSPSIPTGNIRSSRVSPMPGQKRASPFGDASNTQPVLKRIKAENTQTPGSTLFPLAGQRRRSLSSPISIISSTAGPKKRKRPEVEDEIKDEDEEHDEVQDNIDSQSSPSKSSRQLSTPTNKNLSDKRPKLQTPNSKSKDRANIRNKEYFSGEDSYVEDSSVFSGSSSGEENEISNLDHEDIEDMLTREKARRLAAAVKVPVDSNMSEEEKNLYLGLALRGIKPVMSFTWSKDFSTLPESLFAVPDGSDHQEASLAFKAQKGTDFAAIRAFRELLEVGGYVRDCRLLTVKPQVVIQRSIKKYIRWAVSDAGLRVTREGLPVHVIYTQRSGQTALSAVTGLSKKMERLAERYRKLHSDSYFGKLSKGVKRLTHTEQPADSDFTKYWPTLVGFLVCGPIMTIASLDTDPTSVVWSENAKTRVKYLGQFDMSGIDQDVWNSLAIAIAVISMRNSLSRLANAYSGPLLPRFRHHDDDTDDDDL